MTDPRSTPPRDDAPPPEHESERRPQSAAPQPGTGIERYDPQPVGALVRSGEAGAMALTAQVEARIRAQYFLARQFPRNWMDVSSKLKFAFKRPILAEGAIYSKPIGGGRVEGLSIRFAEEAFRAMGNVIVETILVSDDDDKRVYTVIGMDMETNASLPVTVVVTKQIERSTKKPDSIVLSTRTNSRGQPTYILRATSEDDYRSKEAAQLQKARRDVILFLVPGDIREECEQQIRATLEDRDAKDPQAAVTRVVDLFHSQGVTAAELEKFLGHPLHAMNGAELHVLRALYTAIKEGEGTWAQVIEQKLGTNTGADGKGASAGLRAAVAKEAPAAKVEETIPAAILALAAKKKAGKKLSDDDAEELRQYKADHPELGATL